MDTIALDETLAVQEVTATVTGAKTTQADATQDNINKQLYELITEFNLEKARHTSSCKTLNVKIEAEKAINEMNTKTFLDMQEQIKLHSMDVMAKTIQSERLAATIAQLNITIKEKDALLAKANEIKDSLASLHSKIDQVMTRL